MSILGEGEGAMDLQYLANPKASEETRNENKRSSISAQKLKQGLKLLTSGSIDYSEVSLTSPTNNNNSSSSSNIQRNSVYFSGVTASSSGSENIEMIEQR